MAARILRRSARRRRDDRAAARRDLPRRRRPRSGSCPRERVFQTFLERWAIMKDSVRRGLAGGKSFSGLVGGDAKKVMDFTRDGDIAGGRLVAKCDRLLDRRARGELAHGHHRRGARRPAPPGWCRARCSRSREERGFDDATRPAASSSPAASARSSRPRPSSRGRRAAARPSRASAPRWRPERWRSCSGGTPAMRVHAAALTLQNTLGPGVRPGRGPRRGALRRAQRLHGDARARRARRRRSRASRA